MNKGTVAQQGSHEKLMKNRAGLYYRLVNSQLLSDDDEDAATDSSSAATSLPDAKDEQDHSKTDDVEHLPEITAGKKPSKLIRTFGRLFIEQKRDWYWYMLILLGSAGAGGKASPTP